MKTVILFQTYAKTITDQKKNQQVPPQAAIWGMVNTLMVQRLN